ncbi:MAG TPA: C13 family peptidase [Caulobacteraceae bacterium]|jgi:hypothetical protein
MVRWTAALLAALACTLWTTAADAAGPFANWAAVVVSGDFHASHTGEPSDTFDNARRDVAAELVRKGFSAGNLLQFSARPDHYPGAKLGKSDVESISDGLHDVTAHARGGCLAYFTSHGAPSGVVIGDEIVSPTRILEMIGESCGERPTIVILSACFSGVFVPALADANTMVMTAARPDRTSFGCGATDKYPYFDACVLQVMPSAHDFIALATAVKQCVADKETEMGAQPPSEPQIFVGPGLRPFLPLMAFASG